MKQTFSHTLTFYLIATIVVLAFAIFVRCADADELTETVKDWGTYTATSGAMIVNVRESLTLDKAGFSDTFADTPYKKVVANATESAKKMLRKIWDTPGVSNLRYSSYSIVIFKAVRYNWAELEGPIVKIFEEWAATPTQ
jgi:hypothetical protein